jgi:hypothetical protein
MAFCTDAQMEQAEAGCLSRGDKGRGGVQLSKRETRRRQAGRRGTARRAPRRRGWRRKLALNMYGKYKTFILPLQSLSCSQGFGGKIFTYYTPVQVNQACKPVRQRAREKRTQCRYLQREAKVLRSKGREIKDILVCYACVLYARTSRQDKLSH